MKLAPNWDVAHGSLGEYLLHYGDLKEGQASLEKALKPNPVQIQSLSPQEPAHRSGGARQDSLAAREAQRPWERNSYSPQRVISQDGVDALEAQ